MRQLVIVVGLLGCSGDPLTEEQRELVPCDHTGATGGQCERACLEEPDPDDTGETCTFTNGHGRPDDCDHASTRIVRIDGARGCCMSFPENVERWYECE